MQAVPAPGFAILTRDGLRLLFNSPGGPGVAAAPMPDGRVPEPGWKRIQIETSGPVGQVGQVGQVGLGDRLKSEGLRFRNDILTVRGGSQIPLEDPAGNPIEMLQPAPDPHHPARTA